MLTSKNSAQLSFQSSWQDGRCRKFSPAVKLRFLQTSVATPVHGQYARSVPPGSKVGVLRSFRARASLLVQAKATVQGRCHGNALEHCRNTPADRNISCRTYILCSVKAHRTVNNCKYHKVSTTPRRIRAVVTPMNISRGSPTVRNLARCWKMIAMMEKIVMIMMAIQVILMTILSVSSPSTGTKLVVVIEQCEV